jgi:hypothetical protein
MPGDHLPVARAALRPRSNPGPDQLVRSPSLKLEGSEVPAKFQTSKPVGRQQSDRVMVPGDEAPPGTYGTGENGCPDSRSSRNVDAACAKRASATSGC